MTSFDRVDSLKARLARKLGRITEASRLLDLNRLDGEFRGRGANSDRPYQSGAYGKIFYVVDTNFLQAFLRPSRLHRYSRLFHDPIWPPLHREKSAPYDRLISAVGAQATLLATEFVLSDEMDSANGAVYLSMPHYRELLEQIGHFEADIANRLSSDPAYDIYEKNRKIQALSALVSSPREVVEVYLANDRLFIEYGHKNLAELDAAQFNRVRDDYIVSAICRVLAEDDIIEPIEQLSRLGTQELWTRIRPIEWEFSPDAADQEAIDYETAEWRRRLTWEFDNKPAEKAGRPEGQRRRRTSLSADAATLGYLTWACRNAGADRIAFITGDRLILDAYRRWHAWHGEGVSFMVRPLAQFAPQFNLRDARAQLSKEVGEVFERTRQALEASTFTMTFALMRLYYRDRNTETFTRSAGTRARDRFCVDVQSDDDPSPVIDELVGNLSDNAPALNREIEKLDIMADSLRWIERLSVGAVPHLVRRRTQEAKERADQFFEMLDKRVAEGGNDPQSIIAEWCSEKLDAALREGLQFSLPYAVDQILALSDQVQPGERILIGLRVMIPWGADLVTAEDFVTRLAEGRRDRGSIRWGEIPFAELRERPSLIFALAGYQAFKAGFWSDAVRFADFAVRLGEREIATNDTWTEEASLHLECQYLKALSLRVRMASEAPAPLLKVRSGGEPAGQDADVWQRDLRAAQTALAYCIDHHASERLPQPLRLLRATAERASVRLTYCAWAAAGRLAELDIYEQVRLELEDIFQGAVRDLQTCVDHLPGLRRRWARAKEGAEKAVQGRLLDWLEVQTVINPECARLIYERLTGQTDPRRPEVLMKAMPPLVELLNGMPGPDGGSTKSSHPMMKAYILSTQLRAGQDVIDALAAIQLRPEDLALDRHMLQLIKDRWIPQRR